MRRPRVRDNIEKRPCAAGYVRVADAGGAGPGGSRGGLYLEALPFGWPIEVLHSYRSADAVEQYRLVRRTPLRAG